MQTETTVPALAINAITQSGSAGRWRTEAMRSHDTARLIHITRGQGRITVAGLTNGYGPNNLIYIPPRTMYGIEVGPTVFAQMVTLPEAAGWQDTAVHLRILDVSRQTELTGLMEAIERELHPHSGDRRAAHCHLGLLQIFVERQHEQAGPSSNDARRNSAAARLVRRYTNMIAAEFPALHSVSGYAAKLNVTTTHLTRCCRKTCDRSALQLLNDRVHYEACVLLGETRTPVQDIAKRLGFASPAYFTRAFQAKSGLNPTAFRRQAGFDPARKRA